MTRIKSCSLFILMTLLLTGCWDSVNIEDRGFIAGTAVDLGEADENTPVYAVTNQLVLPQGFAAPPGQGGGDIKSFQNITSKGRGINKATNQIATESSHAPYLEHMKVLIVSEELAKKEKALTNLLDHFLRDVNIRRNVYLAIAEKDAKSILNAKQPENMLPAINTQRLLKHGHENAGFLEPIGIGDAENNYIVDRSFLIPYLTVDKNVKWLSSAVFHGSENKVVGILDPPELEGVEFFKGKVEQRTIDFPYKDHIFGFEAVRSRRKVSIDTSNANQLKVNIKLTLEGIIKEGYNKENFNDSIEQSKLEKAVGKQVKKSIKKATDKAQEDLNADIFKIWRQLETKHHDTWLKVKEDWEKGENYFSKASFDIQVDTKIYSTGIMNKTK